MRAIRLAARGFRNLADFELDLPTAGGVFLGPNGHGKTSLLEALYYPVLFRSFRGAVDQDVACWDGPGFGITVGTTGEGRRATGEIGASFVRASRRRRIIVDGGETRTLASPLANGWPWSSCRPT